MNPKVLNLTIPADLAQLSLLSAHLGDFVSAVGEFYNKQQTTYNLQLCVQEICTNIVLHAYKDVVGGYIKCVFSYDPITKMLSMRFYDTGRSFNFDNISEPDFSQAQTSGYGLFIIQQLVDEVHYHAHEGSNEWLLLKRLT